MRRLQTQSEARAKDGPSGTPSELTKPQLASGVALEDSNALAAELLGSASTLLSRSSYLNAVHVLHVEIARALGEDEPAGQVSRAEMEQRQRRWETQLAPSRSSHGRVARIRETYRHLPRWAPRATVAVIFVGLTLRYAYAVHSTAFAKQHPEGDWVSRYYDAPDFNGHPLVRYDTGINYDWGKNGPAQNMASAHWSAQWDTCLFVKADLDVKLRLDADATARLSVDGAPALESNGSPAAAKIELLHGVRHLRLEYRQSGGAARAKLKGLEMGDTDAYQFLRPVISGDDVSCK